VKRYEGLFILDTAGKEESAKDIIDKVSSEITSGGGRIETVQKMDKKQFSRVRFKKHTAGFYVNIIFEIDPQKLPALKSRFALNTDVFRVMFSVAPEVNALQAAAAAPVGAR
jgi:ribosomal protein S6